jgi:hypothetical protein
MGITTRVSITHAWVERMEEEVLEVQGSQILMEMDVI